MKCFPAHKEFEVMTLHLKADAKTPMTSMVGIGYSSLTKYQLYSISRDVGERTASGWGSSITNGITSLFNIAAPAYNETSTPSV